MKRNLLVAMALTIGTPIEHVYAKNIKPILPNPPQFCQPTYYQIPGIGACITNSTPIYEGSFFTWGEATQNGRRIPRDTWYQGRFYSAAEIGQNIIELAIELDRIRAHFGGHPITISSWYRPPEVNRVTRGAAKESFHILGLAADFIVFSRGSYQVYDDIDRQGWPGGLGRYINRTHIDLRDRLDRGMARW